MLVYKVGCGLVCVCVYCVCVRMFVSICLKMNERTTNLYDCMCVVYLCVFNTLYVIVVGVCSGKRL